MTDTDSYATTSIIEPKTGKRDHVIHTLQSEIAAGRYSYDVRLPTEAELCARFGVSRITVRAALNQLATTGLVKPVRGHGWYLQRDERFYFPLFSVDADGKITREIDAWRIWLRKKGLTATYELTVTVGLPPAPVARQLRLDPDMQCVKRRRLRAIHGKPVMISTGYFPLRFPDGRPLAEGTDFAIPGKGKKVAHPGGGLVTLREMGHIDVTDADEIGSRLPDAEEAHDLQIMPTMPVLVTYRTSFDADGYGLRCTQTVFPANRWLLTVVGEGDEHLVSAS